MTTTQTQNRSVALISMYENDKGALRRIEVSITVPKDRKIIDHKVWNLEIEDPEEAASTETIMEVMDFCSKANSKEVMMLDRPLPMSEALAEERCPHCNQEMIRVPWYGVEGEEAS